VKGRAATDVVHKRCRSRAKMSGLIQIPPGCFVEPSVAVQVKGDNESDSGYEEGCVRGAKINPTEFAVGSS